jgi:hypothetical protein
MSKPGELTGLPFQGLKFEFFLSIHMDTGVLKFGIPPDNPVSQIWILN